MRSRAFCARTAPPWCRSASSNTCSRAKIRSTPGSSLASAAYEPRGVPSLPGRRQEAIMQNQDPGPRAGFEPLFRTSPFLDTVGPFFYRKEADGGFVVGLRVLPKHANARGGAHGGLLLTLIDVALGYRAAFSQDPPAALTTASICADFAGTAKLGDWVEAHVDVQKVGNRLAFANAFLMVNGERPVRASAVFSCVTGASPGSPATAAPVRSRYP